jgi:hypothetical protein
MGLQYDGTKMLCRSATRPIAGLTLKAVTDQRGDEHQISL